MRRSRRVIVLAIAAAMTLVFAGTADAKIITGTARDDLLKGTNRQDRMSGRAGEDLIAGRRGNDKLKGGPNVGSLATGGGDLLFLGAGYDKGAGGPGSDVIVDDDGPGPNPLAADVAAGGDGDDIIAAADGGLTIIGCGLGFDIVLFDLTDTLADPLACEVAVPVSGFTIGLFGTTELGTSGVDALAGSAGRDIQAGKDGADTLTGGDENDVQAAGAGADVSNGDAGNDQVIDDDGTPGDTLNGGDGDDQMFSMDGAADTVDCGPGTADTAVVDRTDIVTNCELVRK